MTSASTSAFKFPFASFGPDVFASYLPASDSIGSLARGAMEASTASTRASVKGMQDVGQSMIAHMKTQMSLSVETGKKLAEAESLQDAMSIQTGFMKLAFENNLKGFNELSGLYAETFRDAFAPVSAQAKKAARPPKQV